MNIEISNTTLDAMCGTLKNGIDDLTDSEIKCAGTYSSEAPQFFQALSEGRKKKLVNDYIRVLHNENN